MKFWLKTKTIILKCINNTSSNKINISSKMNIFRYHYTNTILHKLFINITKISTTSVDLNITVYARFLEIMYVYKKTTWILY